MELTELEKQLKGFQEKYNSRSHLVKYPFKNPYEWAEMDTLCHEICGYTAFGLNQAAITLTNHLFESVLKYSLIYKHSIDNPIALENKYELLTTLVNFTKAGIEKYGSITLFKSIEEAFKINLINEEEKRELHGMRKIFRNPYGHADKKTTFGASSVTVEGASMEDGSIIARDPIEVNISEFPLIHGYAQAEQAQDNAIYYFATIDSFIRSLKVRVFGENQ